MSVFISYRREGGKDVANELYQALHHEYEVYLDTEFLKNGRFDTAIHAAVRECTDFILLVTETVFDRCAEPEDWVLQEVQTALAEEKNIIPVFIGISRFPDNVPEAIRVITRYNAVEWTDRETAVAKLKTDFLKTIHRYFITAALNGDVLELDAESKTKLKELYQRFSREGRTKILTELRIRDMDSLVQLYTERYQDQLLRLDQPEERIRKYLADRTDRFSCTFNHAVDYMLQNEVLEAAAEQLQEKYSAVYPKEECFFIDHQGANHGYWTAFLWFDIINKMLSFFTGDIRDHPVNPDDITVDCFVERGLEGRDFQFVSFIEYEDSAQFRDASLMIMYHLPIDYSDVPLNSLVNRIYPSFFFKIGSVKAERGEKSFESDEKYRRILDLTNYLFGLH